MPSAAYRRGTCPLSSSWVKYDSFAPKRDSVARRNSGMLVGRAGMSRPMRPAWSAKLHPRGKATAGGAVPGIAARRPGRLRPGSPFSRLGAQHKRCARTGSPHGRGPLHRCHLVWLRRKRVLFELSRMSLRKRESIAARENSSGDYRKANQRRKTTAPPAATSHACSMPKKQASSRGSPQSWIAKSALLPTSSEPMPPPLPRL